MRLFPCFTILLLLLPTAARAQARPETRTTTIRVRHLPTPARIVISPAYERFGPEMLKPSQRFFLKRGDVVILGIDDPNPLVYEYSLGPVTRTPTDDMSALLEFVRLLSGVPGAVASVAKSSGTDAQKLAAQQRESTLSRYGITPELLKTFSDKFTIALGLAERVPGWIKRSESDSAGVRRDVEAQKLDDLAGDLSRMHSTMLKALHEIMRDLPEFTGRADVIPLLIVASQDARITETFELLKTFDERAKQIGEPFDFSEPVAFNVANHQSVTLSISRKDSGATQVHEFVFTPEQVLTFGFGATTVHAFLGNDSESVLTTVPVLTVGSPRFLNGQAHVQFGVEPKKDEVAVLLGLGYRVEGMFAISAGYIGRDLDSSAFKLTHGWYLGVAIFAEKK
jgi:hypothetical protein